MIRARALAVICTLIVIAACGPIELEPTPRPLRVYRFYMPVITRAVMPSVQVRGFGLAGCPTSWPVLPGVGWAYNYGVDGEPWCGPLIRTIQPFDLERTLYSCNGLCPFVLYLNEPSFQESCNWECQITFLHDNWTPDTQIIFWNGAYPSSGWVEIIDNEWRHKYHEPFPKVLIGVHHYARSYYDKESWRSRLLRFRDKVRNTWDTDIVVTEWGSLLSEEQCRQVMDDQSEWLAEQEIPAAMFQWWSDGLCCELGSGSEPTELGVYYSSHIE